VTVVFQVRSWRPGLLAAVVLLFATAGCSRGPFATVPVAGRVTFDGEPAARVTVLFSPVRQGDSFKAGPSSMATTDSEGRYQLMVARRDGGKGAVPGTHRVAFQGLEQYDELFKEAKNASTVKAPTDGEAPRPVIPGDLPSVRIPAKYSRKPLVFIVPPQGTAEAHFDLTSQ